jgi:nitrite reductase/ring-hydroxylating ferredoxin subunit
MSAAEPIAIYERRVKASVERVWENVFDWEHLPALHEKSFATIQCQDSGPWGWRSRIAPRNGGEPFVVELRVDSEDSSYHSRTVEGPGVGTDIFTRVRGVDEETTNIRVEFYFPGLDAESGRELGSGFVGLYTRLWDEDESMMQGRQRFLDGGGPHVARRGARERVALGPAAALERDSDHIVEVDAEPFRIRWHEGRWVAHTIVCPHWGGPLEEALLEANEVICPWHGYRFDLETGLGPDGQTCRLGARAEIEIDERGEAWISVT